MVDNKLKDLPRIYYLNLDSRKDRADWMESQFDKYEISNYERYSASTYKASEIDSWKHLVIGCKEKNIQTRETTSSRVCYCNVNVGYDQTLVSHIQ